MIQTTGTDGVALTFDDGPSAHTPTILAMLREHGIKATFCVIGVNVLANPGLVQAIVRGGHAICSHSWQHDLSLGRRSVAQIRADLQRTNDEIHRAAPGVPIGTFRAPGGNWTPALVAVAHELGMTSIGWTVDPQDWKVAGRGSAAGMANHIVGVVSGYTHPGAIVLLHDGGGERGATMAACRALLPNLKQRFRLISLPEAPPEPPRPRSRPTPV